MGCPRIKGCVFVKYPIACSYGLAIGAEFWSSVASLDLTSPSQADSSSTYRYRAMISASVSVQTFGCVGASLNRSNLRVNQQDGVRCSALRKVPTDILDEAHLTRATGGVGADSLKPLPREGQIKKKKKKEK